MSFFWPLKQLVITVDLIRSIALYDEHIVCTALIVCEQTCSVDTGLDGRPICRCGVMLRFINANIWSPLDVTFTRCHRLRPISSHCRSMYKPQVGYLKCIHLPAAHYSLHRFIIFMYFCKSDRPISRLTGLCFAASSSRLPLILVEILLTKFILQQTNKFREVT